MRGDDTKQATLFSLVSPEQRVPADHPLRPIKTLTERVLSSLSRTFGRMYSKVGRPSIPPERLLKAQILIALYSVRSDRMFCEQLDYNRRGLTTARSRRTAIGCSSTRSRRSSSRRLSTRRAR